MMIVPGLTMPPGESLLIVDFTYGPLTAQERGDVTGPATRVGETMLFIRDAEPGSRLAEVMRQNGDVLHGDECWARGVIRARRDP
jgi:hypothetical protein